MTQFIENSLTREQFFDRYESPRTREKAVLSLKMLDEFLAKTYPDRSERELLQELREGADDKRYALLSNLVAYWIKTGKGPATVRIYFTFVKSWFRTQGIKTERESIKELVRLPKLIKLSRSPLTHEMISKLLSHCNHAYRAFFLILASSGMRFGELVVSQAGWFDQSTTPVMIKIPAYATKGKQDRFTFISNEAYESIKPFLAGIKPDERVFDFAYLAPEIYMQRLRKKTGYLERYANMRNYKLNIHSFRSFFRTKVSDRLGVEFAYFLLGQEGYLSEYYRKSPEEAAEMYKKVEIDLTISSEDRSKLVIERQTKELQKQHELELEVQKLRFRLERIEKSKRVA